MRSRQTRLRPLFRWFAAATLLVWIGAQALCQTHCCIGTCHDEPGEANCHAQNTPDSHHDDENTPDHHDSADASCATLKSALSSSASSPLIIPEFSLLYTFAPTTLVLEAAAIESAGSFSHQINRRDWVFTPEVCLGPAFRSLAPPFSSLV
jgi:hypothetical protein